MILLALVAIGLAIPAAFYGLQWVQAPQDPPPVENNAPTIVGVRGQIANGKSYLKLSGIGLSLPVTAAGQPLVFDGKGDSKDIRARLESYNPIQDTNTPVCDLTVTSVSASSFRVEVPSGQMQRAKTYHIAFENTSTKAISRYMVNVAN